MSLPPVSKASRGRLLLIPNALDFGCVGDDAPLPDLQGVLPRGVIDAASQLSHWVAENAKTTRAFLKRVDAISPLKVPLQQHQIQVLPRPPKGGKPALPDPKVKAEWLQPALAGHDVGLISEAGLPGVADPGADVVMAAHEAGLQVVPLSGPSSLILTVAGSGLNGQSFAFVGYLPTDAAQRALRIQALEGLSRKQHQTQLVIETPYRNGALAQALLEHLQPTTRLSVASGLTLDDGRIRTLSVAQWKKQGLQVSDNMPTVFAWLAT